MTGKSPQQIMHKPEIKLPWKRQIILLFAGLLLNFMVLSDVRAEEGFFTASEEAVASSGTMTGTDMQVLQYPSTGGIDEYAYRESISIITGGEFLAKVEKLNRI